MMYLVFSEPATRRCSLGKGVLKMCSKYTGEHPCWSAMKSHFGMGVLLYIRCIFSEHLFLRTHLDDCYCIFYVCYLLFHSLWIYFSISRPARVQKGFVHPADHFHHFFTKTGLKKTKCFNKTIEILFSDDLGI